MSKKLFKHIYQEKKRIKKFARECEFEIYALNLFS